MKKTHIRSFALLLACLLWATAGAQDAQDPQDASNAQEAQAGPADADTTWHAPDPPPGEEADEESADAAAGDAGDAEDEAVSDEELQAAGDDGEFQPSEKIRADSALSFPVDI